ncbi:hypothetical protein A9G13_08385 [Gilliamella sp. wkB178]|uniref:murein transglycosylase n=1 Tax=Gilliamella sp. wkB178 TaxID=3120259 RepID=UPI00080EA48E|nr:murein transglycosylase [Gilliamella apicola]OCG06993.1 hypothetical protein A9G13_08385 [Gilliamella apicola]
MKLVLRYFLIIGLFFFSRNSLASYSQQDLRVNYQKWLNSYQSMNFDEQQTLLNSLKSYSLYPYVAVQFFQKNLTMLQPQIVSNFVNEYNEFPLTSSLIQAYLTELTNRQDWNSIVAFPKDNSMISTCRYNYALLQQGDNESAFSTIDELWRTGKELPSECDPLLDAWAQAGNRTANLILLRTELAFETNNLRLARHLTNLLESDYKTTKANLLALLDNPRKLADFSKNITPSPFTKKIVIASFPRLVKADMNLAASLLPQLIKQQTLNETEQSLLQKSLANSYFNDSVTNDQIKWRDDYIAKSHDTTLIEKRIRLAISENNYTDISYWLDLLPSEAKTKEDWQYWQAQVLINNNQKNEANTILQTLTNNRGFYGMVSAQQLNKPYSLNNQSTNISKTEFTNLKDKYENKPVIQRIAELRYWGMLAESNREWRYMLNNHTANNEYLNLAKYAYQKGWGDLSIQATIVGKLWDNWTERLPIMYNDFYIQALNDKAIPLSYALAISRQESAFDSSVQSPTGASGLMQLMPATAKETAKKVSSVTYYSPSQLFDPQINIQLGTYFLNNLYLLNDNNRILASAAYNAGPNRVKRWLNTSDGKLDVIAFIDSIPFTETRNYVKNVLVYAYIYQIILGQPNTNILSKNEFERQY